MNKIFTRTHFKAIALFAMIALGILADQLSKIWVLGHLPGHPRSIIPGALSFVYAENRNMAFGLGQAIPENVKSWGLILLTSLLAVGILVVILRTAEWKFRFLLGLILSGAIGNIIDRVRLGFVVDFIYWHGGFSWPNFNLADSFICVGAALMLILCLRQDLAHHAARSRASNSRDKETAK